MELRSDGKQADGISLVPWKCGHSKCGISHAQIPMLHLILALVGIEAGSVAAEAE